MMRSGLFLGEPCRLRRFALALWIALVCMHAHAADQKPAPHEQLRILLVGNSFLRWNSLPDLITAYLATHHRTIESAVVINTVDGRSIADAVALEGSKSRALLTGCKWDAAIVQGRHGLTWRLDGETKWSGPDKFVETIRSLKQLVSRCNGKVALFVPWDFKSEQGQLLEEYVYATASKDSGIDIIPIGRMFKKLAALGESSLLDTDGSHPGKLGSAVIASAISEYAVSSAAPSKNSPAAKAGSGTSYQDVVLDTLRTVDVDRSTTLKSTYVFDAYPALTQSDEESLSAMRGNWFAQRGGTRLSYGTVLSIQAGKLAVTEFDVAGRSRITDIPIVIRGGNATFEFKSNAVTFKFQAHREGGSVRAISVSGPADRLNFQSANYAAAEGNLHYEQLTRLYDRLDAETVTSGLATALPNHVVRLGAYLQQIGVASPNLDEWHLILLAWHAYDRDDSATARTYLDAASVLFPGSDDVKVERRKRDLPMLPHAGSTCF